MGVAVGSAGAFLESWQLSGDLDHRYPFKVMSVPPPEYYAGVANTIASYAPFVAVLCGILVLLFIRRFKVLSGFVPVIICPLAYIVGLWLITATGLYKDHLENIVNYDGTSAAMRHQEFYFGAMSTMLFSVLVYLVFGLLAVGIPRLLQRRERHLIKDRPI